MNVLTAACAVATPSRSLSRSVRVELHTERLAGAAEALHERRADVVVATMLGHRCAKVEAMRSARPHRGGCAPRTIPSRRAARPIPPALLRAHPQIVLRDSAQGSSPALNVLEEACGGR